VTPPALQRARACTAPTSAFGPTRAFPTLLLPEAGSTPRPLKSVPTPRRVLALAAIRARRCPPVRRRFPLRVRAGQGLSPYCKLKARSFPAYKTEPHRAPSRTHLERRPLSPAAPPLAPQRQARGCSSCHHHPTTPTLSLGSSIPPCVACCSDRAALSPEL
jgi:hypothetical protein